MNSSSTPQEPEVRTEREDRKITPTETPRTQSSSRPSLARSPPGRLSDLSKTLVDRRDAPAKGAVEGDGSGGVGRRASGGAQGRTQSAKGAVPVASAEDEQVAKLRDAMNTKLLLQQRMRRSYGSSKSDPSSMRVSPIQEEEGASGSPSSLNAAITNPPANVRTNSTVSTESTDSSKTVRASNPATPAGNVPIRTPSYPFPYVPGTPRTWSSGFHQPFTALSPTATGLPGTEGDTPGHDSSINSGGSTPAANAFLPPGATSQILEDTRFPTPNLYELVLSLNSEPGIEQWWASVTNTMHNHYKAERVTLTMPIDATDIENVPWGQKATFSMNGPEEFVSHRTVVEQTSNAAAPTSGLPSSDIGFRAPPTMTANIKPQKLHSERLRPRLEARHSYAGHGRETFDEGSTKPSSRPPGPQRTVTHAAGMIGGVGPERLPARRFPSVSTIRHGSLSDPEFSSIAGGVDAGPYAEVFPTLRALNHEARPLIEPGGVNRVLDRGRVVTVTRDYASTADDEASAEPTSKVAPQSIAETIFGNYRSVFASDNIPSMPKDYEEYEQYPTSPWSQSPAPSPAIQANEDVNPFFASEEQQIEDSFESANTPKDYSQLGQVEAIGVEHASTVIHIPLVHPTLSQPMQSLRTYSQSKDRSQAPKRSDTLDMERKAPIAILSILTSTVPYPHNLTQSLKLLGPHLATSLAISQQFSSTRSQAVTLRHRRNASGNNINDGPITIEPASLDDLINADVDEQRDSTSGSVTSPSEYSGRSKHSPTGSIVGTPGWDPATHGWGGSKSVAGTPALSGVEMVDNYFEAKKRSSQRSGSNPSAQAQTPPARTVRKHPSSESKTNLWKPSQSMDEDLSSSHNDRKLKHSISVKTDKSPLRPHAGQHSSPTQFAESTFQQRLPTREATPQMTESNVDKRHTQLHSYGADFHSSFGPLPYPTIEARTPGALQHERKPSFSEDMPPPSERLLRTIIDSVPVQIFTAEPDTGSLTWVNSKFMIYRGTDARDVLTEPWQAIHQDDRNDFMATWQRSLRTAQQLQQKVRLQRFDGSYRWFYVRAAPLKDKRQRIVHWIGTMMDFHEQHVAETNSARQQETAASEAKYRALANSSPQIVFAVDKKRGVTFCNTQWVHFSDQSEAQALGVGFMDHVHPDDLVKCRLPTFDEGSNQPTNVPTSVPPELHRKPSASAESSSGSSETEKGAHSTESSPLTAHMPQRKLSELASAGIMKIARDVDGRPSYSTEVRLRSKDGDYKWHLVRVLLAEPLLQTVHEEETWYGTCTDISDHKALERDLKETMDEKSRFLSNMSHEIRTPLNGILGMVNFLIDSSLSAEQIEHVNIIRASTEGLRGLINDILDLSKAEAGMISLNMDWLYVRALIEEINDLTSTMAIDKGLELNYLVEDDVPAQIKADRFRIRQILLNVVGNAIKFTQKGEVFVRCSIQPTEDGEMAKNELHIKFEVIDTGRGFTEKEAENLFKRFSQIDGSSTRQHGGTGLGLVISQQLAQLHGGDMSARGVPGKGATFTFTIKSTLPSNSDQPPPLSTPGIVSIPILPMVSGPIPGQARPSPKFALEHSESPSPYSPDVTRESPAASSASSDPSLRSIALTGSLRSERSSASSYIADSSISSPPIKLVFPQNTNLSRSSTGESLSSNGIGLIPPMYSILILCSLTYSRQATQHHIDKILPENIPHQITAKATLPEGQELIAAGVIFTHVVIVLQNIDEVAAMLRQILASTAHQSTSVVIITDLAHRKKLIDQSPGYNFERLVDERRVQFVFKPLKPSRLATVFDPRKEREMSTDRNRDSAQQVALTQKQIFEELAGRLGNQGKRVLLVEDNRTNQLVSISTVLSSDEAANGNAVAAVFALASRFPRDSLADQSQVVLKFLKKVSIDAEIAVDGVECTEKVFSRPYGFYTIILCDLHMPRKDGYQTCKEIRHWERQNKHPHLPIIALSANVLGDVYSKCVDAGFHSYLTKPVEFKELSTVLMTFMDPGDPSRPHEFMKKKKRQSVALGR